MNKTLLVATCSSILNFAFFEYYFVFGIVSKSWWLLTLGVYYFILSIVRLSVLIAKNKKYSVMKFGGAMLIFLCIPLMGTVLLSLAKDRGHQFPLILMLVIAIYAFTKITLATINLIKRRNRESDTLYTLCNISFADGFVSIFALQRSMLVSFEGMTSGEILAMNAMTGVAVCAIVFLLGLNLIKAKRER